MPAGGWETAASRREPSEALPGPGAKAAFASRKEINGPISERENPSECGCRSGGFPARIPGGPAAALVVAPVPLPSRPSPVGSAHRTRWGAQPGPGFDAPRERFGTGTANAFRSGAWAPRAAGFGFGKIGLSGTGLDLSGESCPLSLSVLLSTLVLLGAYSKPSGGLDASPPNKPDWRGDAVVFLLAGEA